MPPTEIETAITTFLERFTPPRGVAGNPGQMTTEARQITEAVARFAPRTGFADWWREASTELVRRMKSRAWPLVSEVEAACRAVNDRASGGAGSSDAMVESAALDRMERWFRQFKTQMPGHGKPQRTAELIRRGVLDNERAARFHGFELSRDQNARALDQRIGQDEADHHERVTGDLRAIADRIGMNRAEAAKLRETVKPSPAFDQAGGL